MASNPTPEPKPLSDAEQDKLRELQDRDAAARLAAAQTERKAQRQAFKPIAAFLDLVNLDKIRPALAAAIKASDDPDTSTRLARLQQILLFDAQGLNDRRALLDSDVTEA